MTARRRALVHGTVQGVGFRPFVFQLAHRLGLAGWVLNAPEGVTIEVEGERDRLDEFVRRLSADAPPLARIVELHVEEIEPSGETAFSIRTSEGAARPRPVIPADVATCGDCAREVGDPADRRHRYPFTNCTNCGPRYTIVRRIPYDRPNTTMSAFTMCAACLAEYEDPMNRRFHAQPNACPDCGPWLALDGEDRVDTEAALRRVAGYLEAGGIVAIKGLGGFHLACDARSDAAVRLLRERKGRGLKPFAIMVRDLEEARRVCQVGALDEQLLSSAERPIVIMPRRSGGVSPEIAPNNKTLGVLLPYTPLHQLLLEHAPPALVMTSGNLAEEPIAYRSDEAREKLGHIADHFLTHNREIHLPCDDSVARIADGAPMLLRRARGYVPRPIELDSQAPAVLACGGEQKNTICLLVGKQAVLSQHIGDLDNVETLDYFERVVRHFEALLEFEPEIVAHDLHPEYLSTKWAKALEGVPRLVGVQHHHAHMASVMAENNLRGQVIAATFDGTGFGLDGAIWGGEFLVGDRAAFQRAAHLRYLRLPGGGSAIERPARMALSYLIECFGQQAQEKAARLLSLSERDVETITRVIERGVNSPWTSSMGRLFDAVSALLGICDRVTYEGQAAVELENVADPAETGAYGFETLPGEDGMEIDVRPAVRGVVADLEAGVPRERIAARFHETVARMTVEVCRRLADEMGLTRVMVTGGVAQNRLLLERALAGLRRVGLEPYLNRQVPCNDGGLSFGQAVVAAARNGDCHSER